MLASPLLALRQLTSAASRRLGSAAPTAALRATRVRYLPPKDLGQTSPSLPAKATTKTTKPTKGDGKAGTPRIKRALTGRDLFKRELTIPAGLRGEGVDRESRLRGTLAYMTDSWRALTKDQQAGYKARAADMAGLQLAKKRKIEELLGRMPVKPAHRAYNLFAREHAPKASAQARAEAASPMASPVSPRGIGSRMIAISQREWKALDEATKAEYVARVDQAKASYTSEMRAFKRSLNVRDRALLDAEGIDLRERSHHRADHAPRKSPYLDFLAEYRSMHPIPEDVTGRARSKASTVLVVEAAKAWQAHKLAQAAAESPPADATADDVDGTAP